MPVNILTTTLLTHLSQIQLFAAYDPLFAIDYKQQMRLSQLRLLRYKQSAAGSQSLAFSFS